MICVSCLSSPQSISPICLFSPPLFFPLKKHIKVNSVLQKEITLFYEQNTILKNFKQPTKHFYIADQKDGFTSSTEKNYVFNLFTKFFHPQICHKPDIWRKKLKDKNIIRLHNKVRLFSGFLQDRTVQHVHTTFGRDDGHSSDKRWLMLQNLFRILCTKQTTQRDNDNTPPGKKIAD